jgi:hypothetical protein
MTNILIPVDDEMSLSIYQDEDTGQLECLPMSNGVSGRNHEPVFFAYAEELEDIITMCRQGNYKVFEYDEDYQIELDLEVVSNDNESNTST